MTAVAQQFRALSSVLMNRMRWFQQAGITFGGHRNLYHVLGYKRTLTYEDYRDRYARDGIAKAIVDTWPSATYRGGIEIFEDADSKEDTAFEKAFKELDGRLGFWQRLQQVDTLAGLSTFAVLLIGATGKVDEEMPKGSQVLFLKAFSGGGGQTGINRSLRSVGIDSATSVLEWETDSESERFGEPKYYSIRTADASLGYALAKVHYSRVIHIAEGCLEDDVFGVPVLESVWNLLDDLSKVTGGGAEAHWLRANQGLHLDVDKDMGLPSPGGKPPTSSGLSRDERTDLRDKADEMQHQLQRVLVTRGVTAKQLGSDVANFGPNADAILKQIAGSKGIPMRILTGSEMGTLASEQDAANFDSRVKDRRTGYAGPKVIRRTLDRLIKYGMLPTPKKYEVGWPVEESMDEKGKSDYANGLANTNKTQGSIIFTDDEIRDMAFDMEPLTLEQKTAQQKQLPAAQPVREDAVVAGEPQPQLKAAELAETLKALEEAIENDDLKTIGEIIALGSLPESSEYTIAKGLTREQAIAEAKRLHKKDFRGVKYDAETGVMKVLGA